MFQAHASPESRYGAALGLDIAFLGLAGVAWMRGKKEVFIMSDAMNSTSIKLRIAMMKGDTIANQLFASDDIVKNQSERVIRHLLYYIADTEFRKITRTEFTWDNFTVTLNFDVSNERLEGIEDILIPRFIESLFEKNVIDTLRQKIVDNGLYA